ncbi:MAG: hypothetical protein QFC78_07375 [Pseudomonadota bacterium]|nr:hypothetical protein [Pseudomonadota bacterium]
MILFAAAFLSEKIMTISLRSTGALAVLWVGALAATTAHGQNVLHSNPADPNTSVPPTRYVPMSTARAAAPPPSSPADMWRASNQAVAAYDSMSLTMETASPVAPTAPRSAHPSQASPAPEDHTHHMKKEVK